MNQFNEGVIKYDQSDFILGPPLEEIEFKELEQVREKIYRTNLVGVYSNGIGYGNLSMRQNYQQLFTTDSPQFLISGSQTGHLAKLDGDHYTRVLDFSLEKFKIKTQGPILASSEALTHASFYQFHPQIGAIIHAHSAIIWQKMLLNNYPQTAKEIPYGTKEMALAIRDHLLIEKNPAGVLAMAGHEEGIITYGTSLYEAYQLIEDLRIKLT